MFLVVGSLLSSQNEGCRNTTRLFISLKRGNSTQDFTQAHARLVTTLDLCHTSVNTTDSRDKSLNTPGKNHLKTTPTHLYTLQQKILELSGSTK